MGFRNRGLLVICALFLVHCIEVAQRSDALLPQLAAATQIIELTLVDNGNYIWGLRSIPSAQIEEALRTDNTRVAISEIHLMAGAKLPSIGDLLQIGQAAKLIGAKAFHERDGELKSISIAE